jgi:hypothetical protein
MPKATCDPAFLHRSSVLDQEEAFFSKQRSVKDRSTANLSVAENLPSSRSSIIFSLKRTVASVLGLEIMDFASKAPGPG